MRKMTAGHNLICMCRVITLQITPGRMVRTETTVTVNKVTVSFLSCESAGPALGKGGLFLTVEIIMTYETVRMKRERKM